MVGIASEFGSLDNNRDAVVRFLEEQGFTELKQDSYNITAKKFPRATYVVVLKDDNETVSAFDITSWIKEGNMIETAYSDTNFLEMLVKLD